MSDEHHQQQQQQQQHQRQQLLQQQQQQQQQKCAGKDTTTANSSSSSSSPTSAASTATPRKSNIHEMRNQDFVSRLMAATPPYLYSTPVGANNFFFSDMLRSLVQARNNENARNLQLQQSMVLARRPRKRTWAHHRPYYEHLRERKEAEEKQQLQQQQQQQQQLASNAAASVGLEKPLELTNKPYFHLANKYRKMDDATKDATDVKVGRGDAGNVTTPDSTAATAANADCAGAGGGGGAVDTALQDTPPAASLPPQDLVLPPPPPVWYPPLYPPYGIDPLHFFIDLRVSGHIYDRKKENISPLTSADNSNATSESESSGGSATGASLLNKHRQGSAFTVPVPRANDTNSAASHTLDAINLTSSAMASKFENYTKYYDLGEAKENQPFTKNSASYMLQHLPRLYSQFAARDLLASNAAAAAGGGSSNSYDNDNKSEPDCDADSDGRASVDNCASFGGSNRERDIDVEIIDSIKYRTDGESSRCSSADEASITQID
ncbi:probable basic-leucine zipper transcription factor R [Rhagoletis pomonella]|uniref:probable basic-leucine zipper transcription factor R n=1 Tax=Rhagoletis pomonella TaxID=28610 RepID=UPI001780083B|nr:probable basic-leucine zipper transcription factor R [Rhagoletis pomonella]